MRTGSTPAGSVPAATAPAARAIAVVLGVMIGAIVAGCGQKGALYLPESSGEVITRPMQTPATGTPASEATQDEPSRDAATPDPAPAVPPAP